MLAAAVLALAACGTQTEEDPSLTIGPTGPTEDDSERSDGVGEPTATPPEATTAPSATPTTPTSPGETGTTTDPSQTATSATAPPTTSTETAGEAGPEDSPDTLPGFADAVAEQEATGEVQLLVDDVRLGLQDGYDRVVLDLSGTGQVGWRAEYAEAPALDGSGIPVDLAGDHILRVTARGMAYPEPGDTAYDDGLLLVDGGELTTVTEVLRGVPFEGQVDVYVGTVERAPFRVFRLGDPERLVIDVQQ